MEAYPGVFEGNDAPVAFVGTVDSLVANDTFIDPTRWILRILQETTSSASYGFLPCGDNRFVNNLVYFNRGQISTYVNIGSNTDAPSFQFSNNLWYAHDQPAQSQPSLPSVETTASFIVAGGTEGAGCLRNGWGALHSAHVLEGSHHRLAHSRGRAGSHATA